MKGKSGLSQGLKILNIQNQYSLLEVKSLRSVFINIFQGLALINLNHLLKIAPNLIFLLSLMHIMNLSKFWDVNFSKSGLKTTRSTMAMIIAQIINFHLVIFSITCSRTD